MKITVVPETARAGTKTRAREWDAIVERLRAGETLMLADVPKHSIYNALSTRGISGPKRHVKTNTAGPGYIVWIDS